MRGDLSCDLWSEIITKRFVFPVDTIEEGISIISLLRDQNRWVQYDYTRYVSSKYKQICIEKRQDPVETSYSRRIWLNL